MDTEKLKAEFEKLEYISEKLEYLNFDEHLDCYVEKSGGMPVGLAAWVNGALYGFQQAAKAQAVPELTDKMIAAIESEVEIQLKASAIDADPFRLDGEKIWYAALEAQEPK